LTFLQVSSIVESGVKHHNSNPQVWFSFQAVVMVVIVLIMTFYIG